MKKILWGLAVSAFIMFALPWLAVTFVKGDGGMAACFLLFFAVNPVHSVIMGVFAGKDTGTLWSLPVFPQRFFWLGYGCFLIWARRHLFSMERFILFWEPQPC